MLAHEDAASAPPVTASATGEFSLFSRKKFNICLLQLGGPVWLSSSCDFSLFLSKNFQYFFVFFNWFCFVIVLL